MRNTRDSFLIFLNNELTGITIHSIRRQPDDPQSDKLLLNALNIEFLNLSFARHVNEQLVSLSVINEIELDALDVCEQIFNLLSKQFMIPQYDYTVPSTPVAVDGNILWEPTAIHFRKISSPLYSHFNLTFELKFYKTLS